MPETEAHPHAYPLVSKINEYEEGEMDFDDMVEFFQYLVHTGLAWTFQGHYGRTATALMEEGHVFPCGPECHGSSPAEDGEPE